MANVTRRAALGVLGLAGLGGLAYGTSLLGCRFVPRTRTEFFALLDVVPDDTVTREIGAMALGGGRIPATADMLEAELEERPLIRQALATACPKTRQRLVQDQCSTDFAAGSTVTVDGWVLSRTEAMLCAAKRLVA